MTRWLRIDTAVVAATALVVSLVVGLARLESAPGPVPVTVDQGPNWTPAKRDEFYSLDQGSRIMPLPWIKALKMPDGSPFLADNLRRYGFLPNDASPAKLPVGFTAAGQPGNEMIGMTCAACHTRQIEFGGKAYRIDGGPAIIDFQTFLSDLDTAVGKVLNDAAAFADFAGAVLGGTKGATDETTLRWALGYWYLRYHTLMQKALPHGNPWGPGRVDAVGMIFNRLTGLDLGPPPTYIIESNIKPADAPVRYPFLWNAAKQDTTQWAGFQPNDSDEFRVMRNIGQVLGVFAEFHPKKDPAAKFGADFWTDSSVNIDGLTRLESLMTQIGPPSWPWTLDETLAEVGRKVYLDACNECHKAEPEGQSWVTRIEDVNTDVRAGELLDRRAESGVLEDIQVFFGPLQKVDAALDILKVSVLGIYVTKPSALTRLSTDQLRTTFRKSGRGYEARVLHGVWAAAPYLHNGSVPTLAELLKPAEQRVASFKVGSAYDPVAVGLAVDQTQFKSTLTTTDCSDRGTGNSRCGHDYGTTLTATEKRALLEYLKKL